jgi:NAD(P)-dependent dehydrogenase (short-subunit alcohol dehydrogenase family)
MPQRLENETAVVTGASSGIGRATARQFAREGANVVVATRHREPRLGGAPTVELIEEEGGEAMFKQTDVLRLGDLEDAVDAAVEAYGSLDVMVNNAAVFETRPIEEVDEENYDWMMDTNLKGAFFGCQAAIQQMEAQDEGGTIVNVSSTSGLYGLPESSVYCAAKGGVTNLSRSLAYEKGPEGIRVNSVNPGIIETAMTKEDEGELVTLAEEVPLKYIGDPEEVATVVAFLASDEASYINGHNLVVDGGVTIREV